MLYVAQCAECKLEVPFRYDPLGAGQRDAWAVEHNASTGHVVVGTESDGTMIYSDDPDREKPWVVRCADCKSWMFFAEEAEAQGFIDARLAENDGHNNQLMTRVQYEATMTAYLDQVRASASEWSERFDALIEADARFCFAFESVAQLIGTNDPDKVMSGMIHIMGSWDVLMDEIAAEGN